MIWHHANNLVTVNLLEMVDWSMVFSVYDLVSSNHALCGLGKELKVGRVRANANIAYCVKNIWPLAFVSNELSGSE